MSKEILEKAIRKAIDGGWKGTPYMSLDGDWMGNPPKWRVAQPFMDAVIIYTTGGLDCLDIHINSEHVIFNHDFAKALWGDEEHGEEDYYSPKHNDCSGSSWLKSWEYHLKEMVIADDPIKYLGENI